MSLTERRRAMRHLLDPQRPADARAAYYAFDHPDFKTTIVTHLPETARAIGYACLSRTGFDLFRPLLTMRLPLADLNASQELIYRALPVGASVLIDAPTDYEPLLQALFEVASLQTYIVLAFDRGRHRPIINVLVTRENTPNNTPRYVIRRDGEIGASATVTWQSQRFAEISVSTNPNFRRQGWGRSVVSSLCNYLVDSGKRPIYVVSAENQPSIDLAKSVGFIDTGQRTIFLDATLKPPLTR